jgi:hypothetical protein
MPARALAITLALATTVPAAAADGAQSAVSTGFKRDPALFKAKQAQVIAAMRTQSPEAAAEIETLFRQQDVLATVEPELAKIGLDSQDAADMTAAYWIVAWDGSHGRVGNPTDPAVAKAVRGQMLRAMQANPALAKLDARGRQEIADTMLLQALIAELRLRAADQLGPAMKQRMSDAIRTEAQALLNVDMRTLQLTTAGFSGTGASATVPAAPTPPEPRPAAAARPGNAGAVAGLYFRSIAAYGAGVDWEPLVLFANGDYCEMGDTPVAELNVAQSKARDPRRWGRWRQQAGTYLLTGSDGRTNDYRLGSGNFFPAFPAQGGPALSGRYSRTTSGGTMPIGGSTTVMMVDKISFAPDGSFTEGASMGAAGNGVFAGRRTGGAGRYTLNGTTLELRYPDGRVKRTSFAFGASGRPARPSRDMIFIGGDTYVSD